MRVRAKMPPSGSEMQGVGYYDLRLCRGGEEFELSDPKHFSARWMEKIDSPQQALPVVETELVTDEPVTTKKKR